MPYQPPECDTAVPKNNRMGSGQYNSPAECHRANGTAKPNGWGGGSRRRPSRKYKKSAKRVFRKKSRSTRRR
jgi:hypothetical protein